MRASRCVLIIDPHGREVVNSLAVAREELRDASGAPVPCAERCRAVGLCGLR